MHSNTHHCILSHCTLQSYSSTAAPTLNRSHTHTNYPGIYITTDELSPHRIAGYLCFCGTVLVAHSIILLLSLVPAATAYRVLLLIVAQSCANFSAMQRTRAPLLAKMKPACPHLSTYMQISGLIHSAGPSIFNILAAYFTRP